VLQIQRRIKCSAVLWHPVGVYDLVAGHINFTIPSILQPQMQKATPKQSMFQEAKDVLPSANTHTTSIQQ
jgi:hypothetical protein